MAKMPEPERLLQMTEIERGFWGREDVVLGGMDEVGRGPLAGPVVAACVVLPPEPLIQNVNDSKQLRPKRRALLFEEITANALGYALGWVDEKAIDGINILEAAKLAFQKAYEAMPTRPTHLLLDAIPRIAIPAEQYPFPKGDARSYLIAAASIVAKVRRDAYMVEQHEKYPEYGFSTNMGYGTKAHLEALKKHGPCPIHRKSFLKKISVYGDE